MTVVIDSLAGNGASLFMAGILALWAALRPFGVRAIKMGGMAWLAVLLYVINTAIVTSYHHVAPENQIGTWTYSLLAVGLIYLAILGARPGTPNLAGWFPLLAIWIVAAWASAMAADTDLMRKTFWVFQYAGFATLAFVCFLTVKRDDIIAIATWGILFISEWVGVFQIVDCQFLHGMAGKPIVEGSACASVYDWSLAPHIPTALTTLILFWALYRWFTPKAR